mmetsp:Transcript_10506/g.19014  ORF Transcript_10506/g.19014 Transcript_10506/m.19014 type:complete len:561 (+) Transcript_10506:81-1763(+)
MWPCSWIFTSSAVVIGYITVAHAAVLRGQALHPAQTGMRRHDVEDTLVSEILGILSGSMHSVVEDRLREITEALEPTYVTLPKNSQGCLDHGTVRYALHRLFVRRHAMQIKGLEPEGRAWHEMSQQEMLQDWVPAYVQDLFERRLDSRGLCLRELAILASTLEHLIHDDAVMRLQVAYEGHSLSTTGLISQEALERVVETQMVLFIIGVNASHVTPEQVKLVYSQIGQAYGSWPRTQAFLRDVESDVLQHASLPGAEPGISFDLALKVVEEAGERYGAWQDGDCKEMKASLVSIADGNNSGRVLLRDFYANALAGAMHFSERPEYLRELGALDESDADRPKVIIVNYINSPTNCVHSSSIYSICCMDECEALLAHVEKSIAEPEGDPQQIADVVAGLSTNTVEAPRTLPAGLLTRLEEVAERNGGRVPLHGRLFAQWMHHAFPNECPFPHLSGETRPMLSKDWSEATGHVSFKASTEEMEELIEPVPESADRSRDVEGREQCLLPWSEVEELVAPPAADKQKLLGRYAVGPAIAISAALFSTAVTLRRLLAPLLEPHLPK